MVVSLNNCKVCKGSGFYEDATNVFGGDPLSVSCGYCDGKRSGMTNDRTNPTHGGYREGAGRKASADSKSVPKSIRVTQEVADYLADVGTGIVEDVLRKSKGFKEWRKGK